MLNTLYTWALAHMADLGTLAGGLIWLEVRIARLTKTTKDDAVGKALTDAAKTVGITVPTDNTP